MGSRQAGCEERPRCPCLRCSRSRSVGACCSAPTLVGRRDWQAIDRAEAMGCDAVQVFTQSPRMWRPTGAHARGDRALSRAARRRPDVRGRLPRSLSREPRLPRPRAPRKVGDRHARERSRRRTRSGPRASSSTSAPTSAQDWRRPAQALPALHTLLKLTTTTSGSSSRTRPARRHDRALDGRAGRDLRRLDHHPRLGVCLDSCHW